MTSAASSTLEEAGGSQAQVAYDRLLDLIVDCHLAPGAYASESELAALVTCGRTPVREALQRLSLEGFVKTLPRRGVLVVPVDLKQQLDVLETRLPLEETAARYAAERIAPQEVTELRSLLSALIERAQDETTRDVSGQSFDRMLHEAVARYSRNDTLRNALAPLYAHSRRVWVFEKMRGLKNPHAIAEDWSDIVSAISDNDSARAGQLMRSHVEAARASIVARHQ